MRVITCHPSKQRAQGSMAEPDAPGAAAAAAAVVEEPLLEKKPDKNTLVAEGNVVAACCLFVAGIVFDALNALPTTIVADVPTSLRTTSLVLVAFVAAPPVDADFLFEQRALAVALLAGTSWFGLHHGGANARVADALFSLLGGLAIILIFGLSGPAQGKNGHDARGRRENAVALAAGFLGYSGLRVIRAAMTHAAEAVQFTLYDDDVTARGLAMADDLTASALVFGGVICLSAAVTILLNHDAIYDHGCTPVCTVMAMLSVLVFTAAFVVQIVTTARLEELSVLFGDASCSGSTATCAATYRARRMYTANSSPATLWACAVGLTILAFPYQRRCRTRREFYHPNDAEQQATDRASANASGWVAVLSVVVAILVVGYFSDATSILASVEVGLLYLSIPLAWFGTAWVACGLHAAGIIVYTVSRLGSSFGYDLTYLTHWYVAATLIAVLVLAVTTGLSQLLYNSWCSQGRYVNWIELTTAGTLVALVSMQLSLTVASLGIVSGYDGAQIDVGGRSWRTTSLEWSTQHCVSFFFSAALIGGRFECQTPSIKRWVLQLIWFAVPSVLVLGWIVAMAVASSGLPYDQTGDLTALILSGVAAFVPWMVVGWVVC